MCVYMHERIPTVNLKGPVRLKTGGTFGLLKEGKYASEVRWVINSEFL